ncbi:MAG: hypothetical protein KDD94_10695 [Calditrichaeota bacterium]|nr:hypothetical protein [Calditrichota bacterium]
MLTVGIQGGIASFHSIVCKKYFKEAINVIEFDSFRELADSLSNQSLDLAVMAIQNKIAGVLNDNYRLIVDHQLHAIAELTLNIRLYLMAYEEFEIENLTEIQSHPVALKQCRQFLKQYPKIPVNESDDTANGAKRIYFDQNRKTGIIASLTAAKLYSLNILTRNIAEDIHNHTRFYVLSRDGFFMDESDKLIICGPQPVKKLNLTNISIVHELKIDNYYISEFLIDENDFDLICDQVKAAEGFRIIGAFKAEESIYEED